MTLWVRRKKLVKLATALDNEEVKDAHNVGDDTGDYYSRVEMLLNIQITEFFKINSTKKLINHMFAHIKTKVENVRKWLYTKQNWHPDSSPTDISPKNNPLNG